MKNLPNFLVGVVSSLGVAVISGCSSDSSSNTVPAGTPLEGVWHSVDDGFLIIEEDSIQQVDDISYLNCSSVKFGSLYTANGDSLILENKAAKFNHYSISGSELTVAGDGNYAAVYRVYTQDLPEACDGTELEGRWQRTSSGTTILLEYNAGRTGFYYDIPTLDCLPAARLNYFAQYNEVVGIGRHYEMRGDYRLENGNFVIDWFEAELSDGEVIDVDRTDIYSSAEGNITPLCGNNMLTTTVEVDLTFNELPTQLSSYLDQSQDDKLIWSVAIIFDVDSSGDISTGDMQFTMDRESSKNRFQSNWDVLGGTLGYIQRKGVSSTSRSDIADLVVSVNGNVMKLIARASDFEQISQITSQTPIQVVSYINYDDYSQSDRYPDEIDGFSNTGDNALLEDMVGDAAISQDWSVTPILDIVSIEVTFGGE